jgi:hypothetical protein
VLHLEKFVNLVMRHRAPASSILSNQSPTGITSISRQGPELSTRKNPHLEKWVTWKNSSTWSRDGVRLLPASSAINLQLEWSSPVAWGQRYLHGKVSTWKSAFTWKSGFLHQKFWW